MRESCVGNACHNSLCRVNLQLFVQTPSKITINIWRTTPAHENKQPILVFAYFGILLLQANKCAAKA